MFPSVFFILFILLIISAFAASSETALFSLDRFQLRRIRDRFPKSYEKIRALLGKPTRLLILILLFNESVNLTISSLVTGIVGPFAKTWLSTTLLSLAVSLPLVLLIGEITPKIIAAKMNRLVAMANAPMLTFVSRFFFPILWLLEGILHLFVGKNKGKDPLSKTTSILSEEDILILAEEGHREGTVYSEERDLIQNVFEFSETRVSSVMTPIHQAFSVSASATIRDVLPEIRIQKYSRIPVYQKSRRNIVGILYVKDLMSLHNHKDLEGLDVKSLMAPAIYINPEMTLSGVFRKFKQTKTHMAICVDNTEQAVGVVTMEDVLESIFGEIEDERDITA